ncbi:MAG: CotH kinase family protein [Bacteroidales bacterium]|nr:CotH kinase family protein [Bacteroidales bacterium]
MNYFTGFLLAFIIFISFYACQSPENKRYELINCDAENLSEDDKNFIDKNHQGVLFSNDNFQSNDQAHLGKHSIKVCKRNPYGTHYVINNVQPGEFFDVNVWRLGGNKSGHLVIATKGSNNYYNSQNISVQKEENGWERLNVKIIIPSHIKDDSIIVYLWNSGKDPIYFDDLSIKYLSNKKYSDKENPALYLYVDEFGEEKLNEKRINALKNNILETEDDDWVEAILFYKEEMMPAKMRLKGDWLDHLKGHKWSFRIKLKKGYNWKNMRTFSIQNPESRGFVLEWMAHEIFRTEDVLATRYGFIPVVLNGVEIGIYAYEEHFEKQIVENMRRREGPVLKFSDEAFWTGKKVESFIYRGISLPFFDASVIKPFKQSKTVSSSTLYKEFLIGQNLLFEYKQKVRPAHEIFDLDNLAKYYALSDITRSYHSLVWHNQRFYYNPITSKLEIIVFDGFTPIGPFYFCHHPILGNLTEAEIYTNDKYYQCNFYLFTDTSFVSKYIHYLEKYSEQEFIDSTNANLLSRISEFEKLIQREYTTYEFDYNFLNKNINAIKSKLPKYKDRFHFDPFYAFPTDKLLIEEPKPFDTLYNETFPEKLVCAYKEISAKESKIRVLNYLPQDVILVGTGKLKKNENRFFRNEITIKSSKNFFENSKNVPVDEDAKYLFFKVKNHETVFVIEIFPWPYPGLSTPLQKLEANNVFPETGLYLFKNDTVFFSNKKHRINKNIIIPKGFTVVFEAGAKIDLIENAIFISYSPVIMKGFDDNKIIINSSDKTGMGFTIMQCNKKSSVENVIFRNLNTLDFNGWFLTGAVNFYESDVSITNTKFEKNYCEDALNIIRSDFEINNCSFENIFLDAFDSDFCSGIVKNTTFDNVGNDAIDFSGSEIYIDSCKIININDKGISGGEESILFVRNTNIENCNIGIASKDLSRVEVFNSQISNCEYGLVAFQKKPEFGPALIITKKLRRKEIATPFLIERKSELDLNGRLITGKTKNVAKRFY